MPIVLPFSFETLSQSRFHELDYFVMGQAFAVHNDLGRFLDEKLYENELTHRLRCERISVDQQVPIELQFGTYSGILKIDMVVGQSTVYELKTAIGFAPAHRAQALTYLFLTNTRHGKLLNFGTPRVESEFVSTQLTTLDRKQFSIDDSRWIQLDKVSRSLKLLVCELVADWGLDLDIVHYRTAIAVLSEAQIAMSSPIELRLGDRLVGTQAVDTIDFDTLLAFTALEKGAELGEQHLRRLLGLSGRRHLQWINLRRHGLDFITLVAS